uniref:Death domain-containing protein n=1 Tax=Amphimedon queenslandica TaxID=400682 RepID=A0A1X7SYZ3_AMPQE
MATKTSSCSFSLSLFSSFLTIEQLIDVLNLLKRCGFPQRRWKELGLTLGLHKNSLDVIAENYSKVEDRFIECIARWLSRADNVTVDSKGGATFDSLSDAFKSMNENAAADKLDQEKRKAKVIDIFNTHHPLLSQSLSDPVNVAIMLQREGVITGQVLASVESASPSVPNQREVLLAAIIVAIENKYSLLQTFASVLCKFTGNVRLGTVVQRDYDAYFSTEEFVTIEMEEDSSTGTVTPSPLYTPTAPTVEIPVRKSKSREFSSIRASLARMIFKVSKAITQKSPPLIDLKSLICLFNSDLKGKLAECNDISSVVHVIEGECTLTDIELLETVVEEFEVTEAERYIEQYKTTLEKSCHSLSIDLCLKEKFDAVNTSPSLKCESATFVFDWRPNEKKLKDIIDILSKTSGKLVKIKYIKEGSSIIVTCSFPHSLTGALIIKLNENLESLIKNGLMKLTVGYCTIWKKQKIQEIQEPLQEEVEEIKEQPHDTKEERVARLEEKETKGATPQSVINQDILSSDTRVTIINRQLIKDIKTNKQLEETVTKMRVKEIQQHLSLPRNTGSVSHRIKRGMRMEIEQLQLSLSNKTGLLDQNESLIDIKREIAELQEQISVMSVRILNKRKENEKYRNIIRMNKPTAESIFVACYDYHAMDSDEISFGKGEQLEICEKESSFHWEGRSLMSGDEGVIPSSCVYSMLESLQLLEFILSVKEVSLPILQKIRNDSFSNDEKAYLFLETINDDPIMISALRQDKEQHDEGNICDYCDSP